MRHDNEQIHVRIRLRVTISMRTKKDYLLRLESSYHFTDVCLDLSDRNHTNY